MATKSGDVEKFKQALDKQNQAERGGSKHARDAAEADAAHHGLGALEEHSKGKPERSSTKQTATTKKSPQTARSQSR